MTTTWLNAANNVSSTIAEDIDDAALEVDVATGTGADFPSTPFLAVIGTEVVECSDVTGDTLTIARGQDGTSATAHYDGDAIEVTVCAGYIDQIQDAVTAIEIGGGADLASPGPIGGTTPGSGTFTALEAQTSLKVNRPGAALSALELVNSSGVGGIELNVATMQGSIGGTTVWYFNSSNFYINRTMRPTTGVTTTDLGLDAHRFRNLFLSGDAYVGGGDIYGPNNGDLSVSSDQDIILRIDADQGATPGANYVKVKNGDGTDIVAIGEDGAITLKNSDGTTLVTLTSAGNLTTTQLTSAFVSATALTATGRIVRSTITTFTADDTTPSVAAGNLFKTATSGSAVRLTTFDGATAGQPFTIIGSVSPVTTIEVTSTIFLAGGTSWTSADGYVIRFEYDGTNFYEVSRSANAST